MDKANKKLLNRVLVSIIILITVISISALYYYIYDYEAQELEPRYNEMLIEYNLIVEEHGVNSIEALEYFEIMGDYEPHYPYMWAYIFRSIMLSLVIILPTDLLISIRRD